MITDYWWLDYQTLLIQEMLTPFSNWESSNTYKPRQKFRTLIVSALNAYKAPWIRRLMLRVKPNKKELTDKHIIAAFYHIRKRKALNWNTMFITAKELYISTGMDTQQLFCRMFVTLSYVCNIEELFHPT